jgi:hypothetical protein
MRASERAQSSRRSSQPAVTTVSLFSRLKMSACSVTLPSNTCGM